MGNYIYGTLPQQNVKILESDLLEAKTKLKKTITIEKNIILTQEESELMNIKKNLKVNKKYVNFLEEIKKPRVLKHVVVTQIGNGRENLLKDIKLHKKTLKHVVIKDRQTDPFNHMLCSIKKKEYNLKKIIEDGRFTSIKQSNLRRNKLAKNLFENVKLRKVSNVIPN